MRKKHNEGFTLLETLIAIVVLGIVVVPTCSALLMSFRMNAKTDQLLQDQLAVSSAVETLMAEGIRAESLALIRDGDYGWESVTYLEGETERKETRDRFPDVKITVSPEDAPALFYQVEFEAGEVTVTTCIRASEGGGA